MYHAIEKIATTEAPAALAAYSQGIVTAAGQALIFVSGQLPIDPKTGKFVEGDIKTLAKQVIDNIEAILVAGGSSLQHVVRTEIFLTDLKRDFAHVNEEYGKRFAGATPPARQTIQVADLPMGSPIEISCIAIRA